MTVCLYAFLLYLCRVVCTPAPLDSLSGFFFTDTPCLPPLLFTHVTSAITHHASKIISHVPCLIPALYFLLCSVKRRKNVTNSLPLYFWKPLEAFVFGTFGRFLEIPKGLQPYFLTRFFTISCLSEPATLPHFSHPAHP